jgi:hypothetical protein
MDIPSVSLEAAGSALQHSEWFQALLHRASTWVPGSRRDLHDRRKLRWPSGDVLLQKSMRKFELLTSADLIALHT